MLESPGQRDYAEFKSRLRRLAESPRTRKLDALEKLWKGISDAHDDQVDALAYAWNAATSVETVGVYESIPLHMYR